MCVDDDEKILHSLKELIETAGYRTLIARDGAQALAVIGEQKPDLLLLDVMMPGMQGYEVCAHLQQTQDTAYIPVIFVSSLGEKQDRARAFAAGAVDYVAKPFDCAEILDKVAFHVKTHLRWQRLRHAVENADTTQIILDRKLVALSDSLIIPSDFPKFKLFIGEKYGLGPETRSHLAKAPPEQLYPLLEEAGIAAAEVAMNIATFLHLPYIERIPPDDVQLGVLPASFCKSNHIIAIRDANVENAFVLSNPFIWDLLDMLKRKQLLTNSNRLKIAISAPENFAPLFAIERQPESPKKPAVITPVIEASFSQLEQKLSERYEDKEEEDSEAILNMTERSEPIILLANKIIEEAYDQNASDIHIEPHETQVIVRYRIDGRLQQAHNLKPARIQRPLISRLKIMSDLDIAERRLPQDGRLIFKKYNRKSLDFDLRVSIAPMVTGEKVVMRILKKNQAIIPLTDLGLSAANLKIYRQKIKAPYGMILHVGPTGSGKSMTLYSALSEINSPDINIQTIEDPVEYTLPGINQLQVNQNIGLTFAQALRSFLRQDPDVVLLGEIRDQETAKIAVEASLTGHLLLSTLHTNDAPSTITRFMQLGVPAFMVSASLVLICAQRLIRRLCNSCKQMVAPMSESEPGDMDKDQTNRGYAAVGCPSCNNTGYKGRIGIHEILVSNDSLRTMITQPVITVEALRRAAIECGMRTLYQDGIEKVAQGISSYTEVVATTSPDEM